VTDEQRDMSGERLLPDPVSPREPSSPAPAPPWDHPERGRQPPDSPESPESPATTENERPAWPPQPPAGGPGGDEGSESSPYSARFQLILGALLGIAAVAVVAALLIGAGPSSGPDRGWSAWHPSSDEAGPAAQEIANHVAPSYRLDAGGQLVAATGGQLEVANLPVRLALAEQGQVSVLQGDGVLYTLCGLGPKCSIQTGKPTPRRHLLLRREALELALYTFHYVKGTDYVVALLPPKKGTAPTQAMFFTKDDLKGETSRPLITTLASPPPTSNRLAAGEISTLQALTDKRLFQFKYQQGQDASVFLVLSPFATG
jgi:hypothetical protein